MPLFDLTLIPFVWTQTNDESIVDLVGAMAADPENHELLRNVVTLLPVGDLVVSAHEPVLSTTNHSGMVHSQTKAIRAMEGSSGHYLGMMSRPTTGSHGLANRAARTVFSLPHPFVIGHELGHTMSLNHAACGSAIGGLDPSFPYSGGSIGVWGYDFRDGGKLVPPDYTDLMGYCNQRYWISDYNFTNALRFRLFDERPPQMSAKSLLLWGGMDPEGEPFLEPAFVVDAPAALPDSAGEYRVTGRTASGGELFSLSFTMPETADGDGKFVVRLRAAGAVRVGEQPGQYHAVGPRRIVHPGRRQRSLGDDPAQPAHRAGAGDPARPAACGPGRQRRDRQHRRTGSGSAVQPRNPRRRGLETLIAADGGANSMSSRPRSSLDLAAQFRTVSGSARLPPCAAETARHEERGHGRSYRIEDRSTWQWQARGGLERLRSTRPSDGI